MFFAALCPLSSLRNPSTLNATRSPRLRKGDAAMGIFARLQDYFQDKTMDAILRRKIIYNVAWEDPRIDGEVLALGEGETILMLTTGGCNVLDRLLDGVAHIVSADLNPCQNALLELKLAAASALAAASSSSSCSRTQTGGFRRPLQAPAASSAVRERRCLLGPQRELF